jgi:hypothetical protein
MKLEDVAKKAGVSTATVSRVINFDPNVKDSTQSRAERTLKSEDITYSRLNFDMVRPTVSEFRVLETGTNIFFNDTATTEIYTIQNGHFAWSGDLGPGWTMVQEAHPETGKCWRLGRWDPFSAAHAEDLGGGGVRLTFKRGAAGMSRGEQFQFSNVDRDTTSAVKTRCKGVAFRHYNSYAFTGMGLLI